MRTPVSNSLKRFSVIALFLLGTIAYGASPANAISCGTQANSFDGWYDDQYTILNTEGASSNIIVHGNNLCTGGAGNDLSAWTMIADPSVLTHYAQSGFLSSTSGTYTTFAEASDGISADYSQVYDANVTAGGQYHYWEQYSASCLCIKMNIGTHTITSTKFNPFATKSGTTKYWNQPFQPQFFDEVQYPQDNQLGTVNFPVDFSSTQYQNYSDQFVSSGCTILGRNNDTTNWGSTKVSCSDYTAFTKVQR